MRTTPIALRIATPAVAVLVAAAGCGVGMPGAYDATATPVRTRLSSAPVPSPAESLLALGESEWAEEKWDETPLAVPAEPVAPVKTPRADAARFAIYVGGGMSMPLGGGLGSAAGSVPAQNDVWRAGTAFEALADFGPGKTLRAYAQIAVLSFNGNTYVEPTDPNAQWYASNSSMTAIMGGIKMGGAVYAKVGAGLLTVPDIAHVDATDGFEVGIYEQTTGFTLALGGGYELALGKLRAYVDLNYTTGVTPTEAENAVILWPGFAPSDPIGIFDFKIGAAITF